MMKMILKLLFGFFGSNLFVHWFSVSYDENFSEMFVNFVLDPLNFFQGALLFTLSVFFQGELITYIFATGKKYVKRETQLLNVTLLFIVTGLSLTYVLLYVNNILAANLLLIFSFFYGFISELDQNVKQRNY